MLKRVRLKAIAFPVEHGGWGLLFEPITLGLILAPSWSGLYISVMAVAAFLIRHPFKLVWRNRQRGIRHARIQIAIWVTIFYAAIAVFAFIATMRTAGLLPLIPLFFLSPFALIYLIYYNKNLGRFLLPELIGSAALAVVASCIVLAKGWPLLDAFFLWVILLVRVIPSILYVRAKLRLEKGQDTKTLPSFISHASGLAVLSALAWLGSVPIL
ncbi:MAG: YwiC-like family protein, partial [bacterium]